MKTNDTSGTQGANTKVSTAKTAVTIIGVGNAGTNIVNALYKKKHKKVNLIVANTNAKSLHQSPITTKILLGEKTTYGLGAAGDIETGKNAAQESITKIRQQLCGSKVVIICAGFGGGTGTGATPIIARVAKEEGALVCLVATKPYLFEGRTRASVAEAGLQNLGKSIDFQVILPNDFLLYIINCENISALFKILDFIVSRLAYSIAKMCLEKILIRSVDKITKKIKFKNEKKVKFIDLFSD